MTRPMLPPRNLVYPTKAVFRKHKLPPALWETWSILRAIAWVNGYEFTPPTSLQDLVDLHNGSGCSERRLEARALIDRLSKLESLKWVMVKRETGKKNVYYPVVPEDTAFSTERASDYRGLAADSMRGDGKPAQTTILGPIEQVTYAVDCTPPIVGGEGTDFLPVLDEINPPPPVPATCTHGTYAETKKILRAAGLYDPHLSMRANVVTPDTARAWARWISWAKANPGHPAISNVERPVSIANYRLRDDPTALPDNLDEVADWERACAEEKRLAEIRQRQNDQAEAEDQARGERLAGVQAALEHETEYTRAHPHPLNLPTYPRTIPGVAGTAQEVFHQLLGDLQLQMTKATFDTWVRPLKPLGFDIEANALVILCHSPYAKEWHENRLSITVQRTLTGIVARSMALKYVI